MEQVSNGIESVVKCIFKLESSGSWGHRFRRKANTYTLDAPVPVSSIHATLSRHVTQGLVRMRDRRTRVSPRP